MKTQATLSELIERYLEQTFSAEELKDFESKMQQDPALKMEIETQQMLMKGIDRAARKHVLRQEFRRYRLIRKIWVGAVIMFAMALALLTIYLKHQTHSTAKEMKARTSQNNLPLISAADSARVPVGQASSKQSPPLTSGPDPARALPMSRIMTSDEFLPINKFEMDSRQEKVFATPGGLLFAVPSNAFVNEKGAIYTGKVNLTIQEALDPATIIKGGLSTFAGDKLLETAGMFNVVASDAAHKELKLAPGKTITTRIPYQDYKPGMQLYDGERRADGSLNWVNPQPLENFLVSVDIHTLDFYPPLYIYSLCQKGCKVTDKAFTDSLYYSFIYKDKGAVDLPLENSRSLKDPEYVGFSGPVGGGSVVSTGKDTLKPMLHNKNGSSKAKPVSVKSEGINPAKIKAIWNSQFQNTLLSTKEFEQRMVWIHSSCSEQLLDLYVKNLNLPMWQIDSMAMKLMSGNNMVRDAFRGFYKQHHGSVNNSNVNARLLNEYYQKQSVDFTREVEKTQRSFWAKQKDLDRQRYLKIIENSAKETKRVTENFSQELDLNMRTAYASLGIKMNSPGLPGSSVVVRASTMKCYTAKISTLGWKNIDQITREATASRTSIDYTDPHTGKRVLIQYDNLFADVAGDYQLIKVCLMPDKLNSYMVMAVNGKGFAEKLNSLITYNLVATGYREDGLFYQIITHVKPGIQHLSLKKGSEAELDAALKLEGEGAKAAKLEEEVAYQKFILKDDSRITQIAALRELSKSIRRVVLPCATDEAEPVDGARVCMLEGIKDSSEVSVSIIMQLPKIFLCGAGDYRDFVSYDVEILWGKKYAWKNLQANSLGDKQLVVLLNDMKDTQNAHLRIYNMKFRKADKSLGTARDLYLKLVPGKEKVKSLNLKPSNMTILKKTVCATAISTVLILFMSCSQTGKEVSPRHSYTIIESIDTVMTNENPKDLNSPLVPKIVKHTDTVWSKN